MGSLEPEKIAAEIACKNSLEDKTELLETYLQMYNIAGKMKIDYEDVPDRLVDEVKEFIEEYPELLGE